MDSQGASSDADRSAVIFREVTAESRKDLEALALARITWVSRMGAPGVDRAVERVPRWETATTESVMSWRMSYPPTTPRSWWSG
jgi:hypothetical protein